MILPIPQRRFDSRVLEMMDRPGVDEHLLRDDLRNLRIINRFFGGYGALRHALAPLLKEFPGSHRITLLDLATGSADLPIMLVRLARSLQRSLVITAVDRNPVMLQVAHELTTGFPEITIAEGDILLPRFPEKSFDIVTCSLVLHHFSEEDAARIIGNMKRLARVALVIHDLHRSWMGTWTAWVYTHLTTRNPLTLYDSPLSVLRSFTPSELAELARRAGVENFRITEHPFFRMVLVARMRD